MKKACTLLGLALIIIAGAARADDKWDLSKLDAAKLPPPAKKAGLTFDKDIQPLLQAACVRCHGEDKQESELRLDSLDMLMLGGENGKVVVAADSKASPLLFAVARVNEEIAMPPKRKPGEPVDPGTLPPAGGSGDGKSKPPVKALTPAQVGLIRAWIDQGAK